jgi:hypothetical protein
MTKMVSWRKFEGRGVMNMDQSVFVGKSTPSHGRDLVLAMWWGWQA